MRNEPKHRTKITLARRGDPVGRRDDVAVLVTELEKQGFGDCCCRQLHMWKVLECGIQAPIGLTGEVFLVCGCGLIWLI